MQTLQSHDSDQDLKRYQRVMATVKHLIDRGTFSPGERISSVREMSEQMKVSVTTVLQAYRSLENQGLIEARPQSGFYVRPRYRAGMTEPGIPRPILSRGPVTVESLTLRLMRDTRNPGMVQLGAAVPNRDLIPTEKLTRLLGSTGRRHRRIVNAYDVPPGCEALRVQIAQRALHAGVTLTPEDVMTTCGAQEAIHLALRATCRAGDLVAIESPSFFGTLQTIESLGLRAVEIPTHPRTGISLDCLGKTLRKHKVSACIVITNYNNPLGCTMSDEAKKQLVDLITERQVPLIEDDIYGDLSHGPKRPNVAKAHDREGLVILCSSFSKTLAPGYRVGWLAPGRFRESIVHAKLVMNIASPTPTQLAVAEFLAGGGYDHHLRKCRKFYESACARIAEAVTEFFPAGTRVSEPEGGFVLWVEMPAEVDSFAMYERAVAQGITIAPGPLFSPSREFRNYIRLSCAYWSEGVREAISKLGGIAAVQVAQSR